MASVEQVLEPVRRRAEVPPTWSGWSTLASVVPTGLISDDEVLERLSHVTTAARNFNDQAVVIDDPPLRVLDVALWMYATTRPVGTSRATGRT